MWRAVRDASVRPRGHSAPWSPGAGVATDPPSGEAPGRGPELTLVWTGVATVATALFVGAAAYVTLVEHPARLRCGPPMAVAQFRSSSPRGAAFQSPLAAVGCVAGTGAWLTGAGSGWLGAGLLAGLALLHTLVCLAGPTRRLLDRALEPDTPEADRLLRRWGRLHLVHTLLGLAALGWMLSLAR